MVSTLCVSLDAFQQLCKLSGDLDEALASINKSVRDIALSIIGKKSHNKKNWISDEILQICEQQMAVKREIRNDKQQKYEYNLLTRKLKVK